MGTWIEAIIRLASIGVFFFGVWLFVKGFIGFFVHYSKVRRNLKPGAHQWPPGKFHRYLLLGSFTVLSNVDSLNEAGIEAREHVLASLRTMALGAVVMSLFFVSNRYYLNLGA